ncbi:MAG: hypothetical protein ABSH09_24905, partial [Bryobacteraceae bacterium]
MARCRGKLDAHVLFFAPRQEGSSWVRSDLWRDAAAIPGVQNIEDREGLEIRRFGASTSGQTLLYDAAGRLAFNGGITAARGHLGGNDGLDAVISIVESGIAQRHAAPVFGCSLLGEEVRSGNYKANANFD